MALNWKYKETREAEIASIRCGLYRAVVVDCDGDFSTWSIELMDATLATGTDSGTNPYHFDKCKDDAEGYLRSTVAAMNEALVPPLEDL